MHAGQLVFAQLMDFVPRPAFNACVRRYRGDQRLRGFSCRDQFLCLAFAQLTFRESLRAGGTKLYHAGFRGRISRSTLADANRVHDWRIYAEFAHVLIRRARCLYAHEPLGAELEQTIYAFDATTIDLCLSLFPWANFRRRKAAVKLHTLLDLRGNIPCFVHVSQGKTSDVSVLDQLPLEPGAFYVMDRGYVDFQRLFRFTQHAAFFVTRGIHTPLAARRGLHQRLAERSHYRPGRPEVVAIVSRPLRRVVFYDTEHDRRFVFLTNNFLWPALTIAQFYQCCWQVKLFFKWIKQHLRIKAFYGRSDNAVKTPVWIAISIYVLLAIIKKELRIDRNLYGISQVLSLTLFENTPLFMHLSLIVHPPLTPKFSTNWRCSTNSRTGVTADPESSLPFR